MMQALNKKITLIIFASALLFAVVASVWDYMSGDEETWIHYRNLESPRVLGEYDSSEECAKYMKSHEGPSGCRRIDGPYRVINAFADLIL
ncbi:hypothetical protein ACJJIE_10710 [Microbulbifer sp. TRSA001]|uniref:hypothetical protein n=1 Tax=Microbulbifer sp. TRSA001 TaxID=3243381 RepID=UPI0040393C6E